MGPVSNRVTTTAGHSSARTEGAAGLSGTRSRSRRLAFLPRGEGGDVGSARQRDPDRVVLPREQVVALERAPEPPGLDAHDGVHDGVEVVAAAEDAGGNRGLGQLFPAPGEGLLDDETEELLGAAGGVEVGAGQDLLDLAAHDPCAGEAPPAARPAERPRPCDGARTPAAPCRSRA